MAVVADDPSVSGDDDLTAQNWILDAPSLALLAEGAQVPTEVRITASFDDAGAIGGSSGCNTYGGSYTTDGDSMTIGGLFSTQIACQPPLDAIESAYLAALGNVNGYQISGDTLVLTTTGGALSFTAEQPLPLVGTAWQLESVATGADAVSSVVAPGSITFADDGTVDGSTGCNTFNGSYTVDGASLSIGPLATTKIGCPEDVAAQETVVLLGLDAVSTFTVEGSSLSLMGGDGAFLLGYRA